MSDPDSNRSAEPALSGRETMQILRDCKPGRGRALQFLDACLARRCTDASLLSLDEANQLPDEWPFEGVPVLAPEKWSRHPPRISQQQYCERAGEVLKCIVSEPSVLSPTVVVAGSAAVWPLMPHAAWRPGDIDLFVTAATTREQRHLILRGVADACRRQAKAAPDGSILTLREGLASFRNIEDLEALEGADPDNQRPIQLMMQTYSSIAFLLSAFDVAPCGVAFDGATTWLTPQAAVAYRYGVFLVDPRTRDRPNAARMAKYFDRGFALGLPNLAPFTRDTKQLNFADATISVMAVQSATQATGTISPTITLNVCEQPVYDIDSAEQKPSRTGRRPIGYSQALRWLRWGDSASRWIRQFYDLDKVDWKTLLDGVPLADMVDGRMFKRCLRKAYQSGDLRKSLTVARDLGLTHREAAAIAQVPASVDLGTVLRDMYDFYDLSWKAKAPDVVNVEWWLETNWNERSPRHALEPKTWYGPHYSTVPCRGALEPPPPKECTLCALTVDHDQGNCVSLPCGHEFHWAPTSDCPGFVNWVSAERKETCPNCRQSITSARRTPKQPPKWSLVPRSIAPRLEELRKNSECRTPDPELLEM